MSIFRKPFFVLASLAASCAFAYEARTVAITDTHYTDGLATSFELAFGEGSAANALYVAYGPFDGGADPKAWQNLVKLADIQPRTSTYTAAAPTGWGTSVKALRFFMADVVELPYDYALEYIGTSGLGEWGDTGYLPTSNTKVELDIAFYGGTSSWNSPLGERNGNLSGQASNGYAFAFFINSAGTQVALNFGGLDSGGRPASIAKGRRFKLRNDNFSIYVDDVNVYTGTTQTFSAADGWTFTIGGFRNGTASAEPRGLQARYYGLKIWEGDELVRNFVPCVKNGAVGLYDHPSRTMVSTTPSVLRAFAPGPVLAENGDFGAVEASPVTVFASGSAPVGSATRTMAIVGTNRVSGAITSLDVAFSPSWATNFLYLAYGATNGGDNPADWDHLDFVKVVSPYETGATVAAPARWGDGILAMRLFLGDLPARPYERDIEWLATTGDQWFDTGSHIRYGQTFTYVWRYFTLVDLNGSDAGWAINKSSSDYCITAGGYNNLNYVKAWINGSARQLSPAFHTSTRNTTSVFNETIEIGDTVAYTLEDTTLGSVWTLEESVEPKDGSSYDSQENIFLCRNGPSYHAPGKRAIYRATLADTATGEKVFNLVPVVKDGEACLYDTVSGNFVRNGGYGYLIAGPETTTRLDSTTFGAASGTISLLGKPVVVSAAIAQSSYTSVSVGYNVMSLGNASAVDVEIRYGPSADALTFSRTLATGVQLGAGSAPLADLAPGRTYYARLVASGDGETGDPSALFSFTLAAPDSPAAGVLRAIEGVEATGGNAVATLGAWGGATLPLYVAYGADYGGETTNGWDHVTKVGDIPAAATTATFPLPAGWGATVKFLRFFFMPPEGGLPEGIVFLDHVEATGTQYIDTLLYPQSSLNVEMDLQTLDTSHDKMTFGVRNKGFNFLCWLSSDSGKKINPAIGKSGNLGDTLTTLANGSRWTLRFGLEGIYANETTLKSASDLASQDTAQVSTATLKLMGLDNGGSIDNRKYYGNCYSFKAYTNGIPVLYLVPCEIGGVAEMFDLVTFAEFPNAGTGTFAAGGDVALAVQSISDVLLAADASAPSLGDVSAAGEWRGDRVTVSGMLSGAGAGDCTITVETSRSGDFTDAVVWTVAGTYGAEESFSVELYDADTTSPRYIVPGATLWYRVKATDRAGSLDATVPASVTLSAGMLIGTPSLSSQAAIFTVTVPVTAAGANTNWAWVVYSTGDNLLGNATDKVEIPYDFSGASFTIPGIADTSEPGTLNWALVISNDCSTAVWVSQTTTRTKALTNNLRYTWKKSVAAGLWEDAASWDAPEGRFAWPTTDSTAYFLNSTTTTVTIASSLVEVKDLIAYERNIVVTFTGGKDRKLKADTFQTDASGGRICVSNLEFEVASGGFNINTGRTMVFHDAIVTLYGGAYFGPYGGANRHFIVSGGTYLRSSGDLRIGGAGSTATIDDSYVDLYAAGKGVFLSTGSVGGELIMKGRNPRLEIVEYFRTSGGQSAGGTLTFVIPVGGFAETPIRQISDRHGSTWYLTRPFCDDDAATSSMIRPTAIRIDPESPGLRGGALRQTLVEWKSGLSLGKMTLGALEKPRSNYFVYSGDFDDHSDWTAEWTDTENAPLAFGFRRERGATLFFVQ